MKKTLSCLALATLAVVGASSPALAAPTDPVKNQVAYWETFTAADDVCSKVEFSGGVKTFTLPDPPEGMAYTLLVLKTGSGTEVNSVTTDPQAGTAYGHPTGKDLSHAISCLGADGGSYTPPDLG